MIDFSDRGPCTPGDPEWHLRLAAALADDGPMHWWWLSFVDTDKSPPLEEQVPGGGGFLGICIVPAPNEIFAAQVAHALGCNPGGQVGFYPACPDGWRPKFEYVGKLFPGAEGMALAELELEEFCELVEAS